MWKSKFCCSFDSHFLQPKQVKPSVTCCQYRGWSSFMAIQNYSPELSALTPMTDSLHCSAVLQIRSSDVADTSQPSLVRSTLFALLKHRRNPRLNLSNGVWQSQLLVLTCNTIGWALHTIVWLVWKTEVYQRQEVRGGSPMVHCNVIVRSNVKISRQGGRCSID